MLKHSVMILLASGAIMMYLYDYNVELFMLSVGLGKELIIYSCASYQAELIARRLKSLFGCCTTVLLQATGVAPL